MNWRERITLDPGVLAGKPVVRGTRLAVEFIVELLAQGRTEEDILRNDHGLTREDIPHKFPLASRRVLDSENVS